MMQGKKWKRILLMAAAAVLMGNAADPLAPEAAGIRTGQKIYRSEQTIPENGGSVTGTQETPGETPPAGTQETPAETPPAGTQEMPAETPAPKAVASVHIDGTDTEYTDIRKAWTAVNGRNARITLLDHVTTTAAMSTAFELTGGDVTLDLGGYQWTYQYVSEGEAAPATFDLIELKGDAVLTVKGSGGGMVYAGSSSYKGACLYATGNTTLNIEGGTYSSNVSAPIYVDGATLNVKGGVFRAAGASESAITMNNGTFSMTGGEVQVGKLTLNNTNGSQDVAIGGDSQLSGIETKGKEALTIRDTLADGYGYQSTADKKDNILSDEEILSGNSVKDIAPKAVPGDLSEITASATEVDFSYDSGTSITLETTFTPDTGVTETPVYTWYVDDGTGRKVIPGNDRPTYTFPTCDPGSGTYMNAGTYTYSVKAAIDDKVTGQKSCDITIKPVIDEGTIKNKDVNSGGLKQEYIYRESVNLPNDGTAKNSFDLNSSITIPESVQLQWRYTWYSGTTADDNSKLTGTPSDAGTYTVKVEASDGSNYTATGTVPIEIKAKTVIPELVCTTTKEYDRTNTVKDARIILRDQSGNEVSQSNSEITVTASFVYDSADVGDNKRITMDSSGLVTGGQRSGNYELDSSDPAKLTAVGSIKKASLKLQIDVDPLTQTAGKPVTVTVRTLDDSNSLVKAGDIILSVSGSSDPVPTLRDAGNGTFTGTFTSSTTGDVSFRARVDTANYESDEVSNSRLTIIRETVNTSLTLTAGKSEITFGEAVTYTATVAKTGSSADNALSGGVQFYIDGEGVSNQVGGAQRITSSGDTVSITMDESVLTVGEHTVTAKFTSDSAEPSQATVTTKVAEKPVEVIKSAVSLKASEETVTYGDEVTYTATVTREGGKAGDALSGGVQFYMDGEESSNRVGTAQGVQVSGDTVSIRLGRSDLSAGDHKISAVFTPDAAEGSKAEVTTKVEKKKLTWDASGLKASKTAGTAGEVKVYGTLEVDGILDGEIKFEQPESMVTNGFKSADAGTYKVTVTVEDGEWTFDPKEPKNYELPEGDPEIRATVNALKELSNPPEAKDGNTYKLMMEEGLSTVPDGLKRTGFNTPGKIESELKRILTSSGAYSEANTAVYDVTLQVSTDDGKTWAAANADNFPAEGVVVTLPYPGGTGRYTHNFAVAHMFGESLFGHTSGTVEVPAVTKTDNGLQFRVTGLSPIAVSWTEGAGGSVAGTSTSPVGTAVRRLLGAQTGDGSPILLYAGLGAGCAVLLLILGIVVFRRGKKSRR